MAVVVPRAWERHLVTALAAGETEEGAAMTKTLLPGPNLLGIE